MSWPQIFVMIAFVAVCFFLIVIILLQKGRGGGLAGAFGGTSGSAFGAKTGDVFTWITVAFAGGYLFLAVLGNFTFRPSIVQAPAAAVGPVGGSTTPTTPAADDGASVPVQVDGPVKVETTTGDTIEVTPGETIQVVPGAEGTENMPIKIVPPAQDETSEDDAGEQPAADDTPPPATDTPPPATDTPPADEAGQADDETDGGGA